MMPRRRNEEKQQVRARSRRQVAAVKVIAAGLMFVMVPMFVAIPALQNALGGLRAIGWFALIAGLGMLVMQRAATAGREGAALPAGPARPRNVSPPEPLRANEPGGVDVDPVIVDDVGLAAPESSALQVPRRPLDWNAQVFDVIEWRRFEAVCERLFGQAGFETKTQSHGADGGIDIWLHSQNHPDGPVSVVQCKRWTNKQVKLVEVRALLGSMTDKKVKRGIFATTSTFTRDATEFANANGIQLLDRDGLLGLIAKRTPEQQRDLLAVATEGDFWVPTCASCGIKMVRRTPKKAGRHFWGCGNYPRCKTTING